MVAATGITLLTATYNRSRLLERLNGSLINSRFAEWIIIDDGSTDDTEAVVNSLVATSTRPPIRYLKRTHGGKHRALNAGLAEVRTDWAVIIDSDDHLLERGWSVIEESVVAAASAGADAAFLPVRVSKVDRQFRFAQPDRAIPFARMMNEEGIFDCTMVLGREIMSWRLPEYDGEDFLAESALLLSGPRCALIYLCGAEAVGVEYQSDGLSAQSLSKRMASPLGAAKLYSGLSRLGLSRGLRSRALVNFGRFWWHGVFLGRPPPCPQSPSEWIAILTCWAVSLTDFPRRRAERRRLRQHGAGRPSADEPKA